MNESARWSKMTVVLAMAACALGGSLVNSSLSQNRNGQQPFVANEAGRFQYVQGAIFDTKTAQLWLLGRDAKYRPQPAPWEFNELPAEKRKIAMPFTESEDVWSTKPPSREP